MRRGAAELNEICQTIAVDTTVLVSLEARAGFQVTMREHASQMSGVESS